MIRWRARSLLLLVAAALVAGCNDERAVLSPAGPAARKLSDLGWPTLIFFVVVSAVMWGLLLWVTLRKTGSFDTHEPLDARGGMSWVVIGGFVIPGAVFTAIFVITLGAMGAFPMDHHEHAVKPEIRVTGHQWWWEVEYLEDGVHARFVTANEIHIPAGRPIEIELLSKDVIHSFWAPRLHGKVDLVPGLSNHIRIEADKPGIYPGGCAEFCGLQHAMMRFQVIAEEPKQYEAWLEHERQPAATPSEPSAQRGMAVFMNGPCPMCHTIDGTYALATVGPNLTHVGSRNTIAAGWLPKDLATLHAWIVNAPSIKPGTKMPVLSMLTGQQLSDLAAYLQSLK